jgi:nicotinamide-nucleotide amidase
MSDEQTRVCDCIAEHALRHGWTIAVAESLTGGELSQRLAAAPQASQWYAGAVVAYSSAVKFSLLDVPVGPAVTATCARQMSARVRELMHADLAVATTGVGGPDPAEGHPPGTVWIGLSGLGPTTAALERIPGDPSAVVEGATWRCLHALLTRMQQADTSTVDERPS